MAEGGTAPDKERTPDNEDADSSVFCSWLQKNGLNAKTIEILTDQGFVDKSSFSMLSVEDIPDLDIKQLAQRKYLEKLLKQTEVAEPGSSLSPKNGSLDVPEQVSSSSTDECVSSDIGVESCSPRRVIQSKEDICKNTDWPEVWREDFRNLLMLLGLDQYYPQKISLRDVQCPPTRDPIDSPKNLPWDILQQLLMADNKARDFLVDTINKEKRPQGNRLDLPQNLDIHEVDIRGDLLHPSDVLTVTLMCCDLLLRQLLYQKMYLCSIAIPFIVPKGGNALELMIWSLKTIVMDYCTETQKSVEISPVTSALNIISFVRLGNLQQSKSDLINKMMAGKNTFFTKMCPNGRVKRKISQGVIEASWFLPSTHDDSRCSQPMMFLNLRGDAADTRYHVLTEYICSISSAVVVLTSFEQVYKDSEVLQKLVENSCLVLPVLMMNGAHGETIKLARNKLESMQVLSDGGKVLSGYDIGSGEDINVTELQLGVHDALQRLLTEPNLTLEQASEKARIFSISPDEDSEICVESKEMYSFCTSGIDEMSSIGIKQTLYLQGPLLKKWTHCYKKQYKTYAENGNIINMDVKSRSENNEEMDDIRAEQRNLYNNDSKSLVKKVLTVINSHLHVKMFFQWMKIMLDGKSRKDLPWLNQQYYQAWNELKKIRGAGNSSTDLQQQLKADLDEAEIKLANASIGMEHVFREMFQLYESHYNCHKPVASVPEEVADLSKIFAKEMLCGLPLEIMDGDNSSIPLTWLKAVFSKLKQKLGESKLLILGVLGVQSSGKSTFLNHLFGLQFAVSAGRCTRGVFAQMVKAPSGSDFDWILVVDTEGLRAPELTNNNYEHDNELATFVLGLSDITIINLKGENTAEMKDVLQTAVHAFIKLNAANRNMIEQKRCLFVHQNVPSASAKDKMRYSELQLQNTLDEMTELAARMEHIYDVKAFNQVIQFDPEFHIWKFPDLWEGEPPMTSVNPAYVEKVKSVKSTIIDKISRNVSPLCAVEDLYTRIEDLWNGICALDFVFAFRNTLEVKAHDILEEKYSEALLTADESVHMWYNQEGRNSIYNCKSEIEIRQASEAIMSNLDQIVENEQNSAWKRMIKNLKSSKWFEIIKQWLGIKERNFQKYKQTLRQDIAKNVKKDANIQKVEAEILNKQSAFMLRVNKAAEEAAKRTTQDIPLSTAEESQGCDGPSQCDFLSTIFDSVWEKNLLESGMQIFCTEDEVDLNEIFYEILTNFLYNDSHFLKSELERKPLVHHRQHPVAWKLDENLIVDTDIHQEFKMLTKDISHAMSNASSMLISVVKDVRDSLDNIVKTARPFNKKDAHSLVSQVIVSMENVNRELSDKFHFSLLPSLKVKLCTHVCRCAIPCLREKQRLYDQQYGMTAKLNACKETTRKTFQNCVMAKKDEIVAAEYICSSMKMSIKNAVECVLPTKMKTAFFQHFGHTKFLLMTTVLDDIANQNKFDDIVCYTKDAEKYSKKWFISHCEEILFKSQETGMSLYLSSARGALVHVIQEIQHVIQQTCQKIIAQNTKHQTSHEWVKVFNAKIASVVALQDDLSFVTTKNIIDYKSFQTELYNQLSEVQADLLQTFGNVTTQTIQWVDEPPYTDVFEKLWGCKCVCPFCKEPCVDTDPDHYQSVGNGMPHRTMQHRPQGITGWHYLSTKDIVCLTCSNYVAGNGSFRCSTTCTEQGTCKVVNEDCYHLDKEYKEIFPSWDIQPNTRLDVSKYWMWIMVTHKDSFKEHFGNLKMDTMPHDWEYVNKEQALTSLRKTYQL